MSKGIYIAQTKAKSGKSAISLGIMENFLSSMNRVGFFRPIAFSSTKDKDIDLLRTHYKLPFDYDEMYGYTRSEATDLIKNGKQSELLEGILEKYKELECKCDFVVCEGTDFLGASSSLEFDMNVDIVNNLGLPVLLISNGNKNKEEDIVDELQITLESFHEKKAEILGIIINRVERAMSSSLKEKLAHLNLPVFTIPSHDILGNPNVGEIAQSLDAKILYGRKQLHRHVKSYITAAMHIGNFLRYVEEGTIIITPGDRADIVLASIMARLSNNYPNASGIVITGGLELDATVKKLIDGLHSFPMTIMSVPWDTFTTSMKISEVNGEISPRTPTKITAALSIFDAYVNMNEIRNKITVSSPHCVTPKMFEYSLVHRAKHDKKRIVLPEGSEDRILKAAEILLRRDVVDIILLGNHNNIQTKIARLGLHLESAKVVDPINAAELEDYSQCYFEMRVKKEGITLEVARDRMLDVNHFGTMMIHKGHADGMVSGSVHTTAHTIRPALQIVRTKPGYSVVSSVFFMCLEDRVLVYGDCAINPDPNAEQLAEIAISSAETAKAFGIDPKVAMLSYSTGSSGTGEDVEKVRKATQIAQERRPDLLIEGPIQYDAAVDADVAKTKLPDSKVAGVANVLIFPDLNTGNNTYKAVQRSANAVAIGPVLQGLNKPVNDLSRGCTIADIVNTVAITAIQAQIKE